MREPLPPIAKERIGRDERTFINDKAADLPTPLSSPEALSSPVAPARLQYLEALVSAANAISATLDPLRVAEVLAACTAELLEVTGVSVMLLDTKGTEARVIAAQGLSSAYLQAQAGPIEQTVIGRAIAEERTFAAWDVRQSVTDLPLAQAARKEGIISVACAPMLLGGKLWGRSMSTVATHAVFPTINSISCRFSPRKGPLL